MKFEIIMPSTMNKKKAEEYKEAIKKNIKENTNIDVDKINKGKNNDWIWQRIKWRSGGRL